MSAVDGEAREELDALKNLIGAYLATWGGGMPVVWRDAFRAVNANPMSFDDACAVLHGLVDAMAPNSTDVTHGGTGSRAETVRRSTVAKSPDGRHVLPNEGCE